MFENKIAKGFFLLVCPTSIEYMELEILKRDSFSTGHELRLIEMAFHPFDFSLSLSQWVRDVRSCEMKEMGKRERMNQNLPIYCPYSDIFHRLLLSLQL